MNRRTKEQIYQKLEKQKQNIIIPKIKWLMASNCTFMITPLINIELLTWQDPITQIQIWEWVILATNKNNKAYEVI